VVPDTVPLRIALADDPEFGRVQVHGLAHGVSLRGEVSSAAAADRAYRLAMVSLPPDTPVENDLRIAGPLQVNLEVQIAEVQRSIAEDFGFNWELFGRSSEGDLMGGFRIGRQLPPPLGDQGRPFIGAPGTVPPSIVDGVAGPSFILHRAWEEIGITGMVDALSRAGLANVLARPNVTANSGETASFFSGGEFPLPTGFEDGVIVFEYKKYGVLLDFVPTIVDDGRVALTVRPEVSEPSRDNSVQVVGVDIPVINVRRAETTVEMGDGESIVIAGLFRSASDEVESGVPVLKDLPLLGGLFGHTSTRADELELIVTVTARLVQAGPAVERTGVNASDHANSYYY
jgi:pilus assembly protein CpaC